MIDFYTIVLEVPASPLGLMPECTKIQHRCARCRMTVATGDLIAHAKSHDRNPYEDDA